MPVPFPRSLRQLNRPRAGGSLWLPLGLTGLAAAWLAWLLLARVTIYAVSDAARVEQEQATCPVEAPLEGRVLATHIVLGAEVHAGDALVELDSEPLQLERAELVARRAGREAELAPLAAEVEALERQLDELEQAASKGGEEQVAGVREAEATLEFASSVVDRFAQLGSQGVASEAELMKARAELEQHRAALDRQRAAKDRAAWERRAQASEVRSRLADGQHELALARGECAVTDAAIARLTHEVDRRTIRAPVAGILGETANLRPGQFVAAGARLLAIVPRGGLHIVAAFRPQDALGRIRIGQVARLRLHGFPWTQYGFVSARITGLASEALSGMVRVEAGLAEPAFPVALQHGWPGALEVEVERIAPATLALRAAGALLSAAPPAASPGEGR